MKKQVVRPEYRTNDLPNGACHEDPRDIIARLNPVLRGWGNYFRSGNATIKFGQLDDYVVKRLRSLRVKRKGRHLRPGEARAWWRPYFNALGLHSLRGTVQYPEAA